MPLYPLKVFAVQAAATFLTRLFPFMLPERLKDEPRIRYVGENLPPAVMLLLVLYCLKGPDAHGPAALLSVGVVAGLHLWKRHTLLSIGLGTACYIALR